MQNFEARDCQWNIMETNEDCSLPEGLDFQGTIKSIKSTEEKEISNLLHLGPLL